MGDSVSGYFWRGPILTRKRAARIINWAGWIFVAPSAALMVFSVVTDIAHEGRIVASSVVMPSIFTIPGGLLLTTRWRLFAGLMLFVAGGGAALMLLFVLVGADALGDSDSVTESAIFMWRATVATFLMLIVLTCLAWRALRASFALRRLPLSGDLQPEAFD